MSAADSDLDREATSRAFRVFLLGMEDVLGSHGLAAVLRQSNLAQYIDNFPPNTMVRRGDKAEYITRVARTIFGIYGRRGARAVMQRVGREQAKSGMAENAILVSGTRLAMRFVPRRRQVRLVIEMAAKAINEQIGDEVRVSEDKDLVYYDAYRCCYCIGWLGEPSVVCHAATGFLNGLLSGMMDRVEFKVEETMCRARGDIFCRYRVIPSP